METEKNRKNEQMLQRWKIFNVLLHSEKGTTYNEYYEALFTVEIECEKHILRKDKELIDKLLVQKGLPTIERQGGKNSRMKLSDASIDICSLKGGRRPSTYYKELLDMLSHSTGFLSDEWLTDMKIHFENDEEDWSGQDSIISFEQNMNAEDYTYLPDVVRAIRAKYAISLDYKPYHGPSSVILFYPEYLKQYKRLWYVFGLGKDKNGDQELTMMKIPLDRVVSKPQPCRGLAFQSSGMDYLDYFSEIIGVENDPKRKVDRIRIQVKRNMEQRLEHNPICSDQTRDRDLDDSNYVGYKFDVKINLELMRILYSYGSDIKVVAPAHLVNTMKKELNKTLKLYS